MKIEDLDITGYETLFLDRDGVINKLRPNDYVKTWEEFEFVPGILDALKFWSKHFKYIFIVTNQRGVGKGLMSEKDLNDIHNKMLTEINKNGGRINKIYFCTATNEEHPDRKPNIGMGIKALQDFPDIDLSKSLMIGDSQSDMHFARKLGIKGVLYNLN